MKVEKTKETELSYVQTDLITNIIKSNDPLDSFKKGYLSFLDDLTEKLSVIVKDLSEKSETNQVQADKISVSIEFPSDVKEFVVAQLSASEANKLKEKLSN